MMPKDYPDTINLPGMDHTSSHPQNYLDHLDPARDTLDHQDSLLMMSMDYPDNTINLELLPGVDHTLNHSQPTKDHLDPSNLDPKDSPGLYTRVDTCMALMNKGDTLPLVGPSGPRGWAPSHK